MSGRHERVVAEPAEVAALGRLELNLHSGSVQIGPDGPDWGDYEINQFLAKRAMGLIPVDEEIPNRIIVLPLILGASGDFDAARIAVEAWAVNVNHRGGGHLKREIIGGSYGEAGKKLFVDAVKATLSLGGGSAPARDGIDPEALLTVEASPDFYGEPRVEEPFDGTGDAAETFQIDGTLPARVESLTVTDKSGEKQRGLAWHFRCDNYSAHETAQWSYNAEDLEALGGSSKTSLAGSYGSKVVSQSKLSQDWMPLLGTNIGATDFLTHAGLYQGWARAYTTSDSPPWLRLALDVGDLVAPEVNAPIRLPGTNAFYLVPLGLLNLKKAAFGDHRWRGIIQGRGDAGGENVHIDRLWFKCADENSGVLSAPPSPNLGITASAVRDEFLQSAGNLTGKAPTEGGVLWEGSGDPDDIKVNGGGSAFREAKGDAAPRWSGARFLYLPTKFGSFRARVTVRNSPSPSEPGSLGMGIIARRVNAENAIGLELFPGQSGTFIALVKLKAGAPSTPYQSEIIPLDLRGIPYELDLSIDADGNWTARGSIYGQGPVLSKSGHDPDLAVGGVLAEGKCGIFDHYWGTGSIWRAFSNFSIAGEGGEATADAVIYGDLHACLSTNGLVRQSSDGLAYGSIAHQNSDMPRLPVSGPEERPVEVAVKPSRGDFESLSDAGIDPFTAQLSYRPCWAAVPGLG